MKLILFDYILILNVILLIISLYNFPGHILGLIGILFIIIFSIKYGLYGGIISAFCASFILLLYPYTITQHIINAVIIFYFLLGIGLGISINTIKKQENNLRLLDLEYNKLMDTMFEGFALFNIIFDEIGKPFDYRFIKINKAFEKITGLSSKKIISKTLTELMPDSKNYLIKKLGEVVRTSKEEQFENYSKEFNKYYIYKAFCPKTDQLAVFITDISGKKQEDILLKKLVNYSESFLNMKEEEIDYFAITNQLLSLSGAKFAAFNLYEKEGKHFTTKAIAGNKKDIEKGLTKLGCNLIEKKWKIDSKREFKIKNNDITRFAALSQLTNKAISKKVVSLFEKTFSLGETVVIKIKKDNIILGNFTIIMDKEEKFTRDNFVGLYTRNVGVLISKNELFEKLKQSEKNYKAVVETQKEMICKFLPDTTLLFVNKAFSKLFNKSEEELLGKKIIDLIPKETRKDLINNINDLSLNKKKKTFEQKIDYPNGNNEWKKWDFFAFFKKNGELRDVQLVVRDITDYKRAENKLIQALSEQELLLDNIETQIWYLLDIEKYGIVNKAHAKFFGVNKNTLEYKTIWQLFTEKQAKSFIESNKTVFKEQKTIYTEEWVINGHGEKRLLEIIKTPKINDKNEVEYIVCSANDITEQKEAEKKLKESEQQLEQFFSQSLDGFFFMMLERPIVWNETVDKKKVLDYVFYHQHMTKVNQALLEQYRAKEEEFLGLTPYDLFEHDLEHGYNIWHGLFNKGRWHVETKERRMDGTDMLVEGDYICLYDLQGRIRGHFGVQRDITNQRKAEKALVQSELYNRTIINLIPDLLFRVNRQGEYLDIIVSKEDKLYKSKEQLIGKKTADIFPENISCLFLENINKALDLNFLQIVEYQLKVPAGNKDFEARIMPSKKEEVFVLVRDITERKKIEKELNESERKYRTLVSNVPGVIFRCKNDLRWTMTFISSEIKKITSYPASDFIENKVRSYTSIIFKDDQDYVKTIIQKHISKKTPYNLDYRVVNSKGDIKWIHEKGQGIYDNKGELLFIDGVITDITDRKSSELKLKYQIEFEKIISKMASSFIFVNSNEIDDKINFFLKKIGQFIKVDRSYLFIFSDDGKKMTNTHEWCNYGIKAQKQIIIDFPVDYFPWWRDEIRKLNPVNITRVDKLPNTAKAEKKEFQRQGIQSLLCLPILINKKIAGFIGFDSVNDKRTWTEEEISLLQITAIIIANSLIKNKNEKKIAEYTMDLELKNLQLDELYHQLDEEIENAQSIHEKILQKKLPKIKGFSIAAYYHPAQSLGGDFYKAFRKGDKIIIYLSDVTGHGLDSALLSSFIKNTIDSYVDLKDKDSISPQKIALFLQKRIACEEIPEDYALSIFIAVIDINTRIMKYTSVGVHTPPLVTFRDSKMIELENYGLPLSNSIDNDLYDFNEKELLLEPNMKILFSTDGLFEQEKDGVSYSERVKTLYAVNYNTPCQVLSDLINTDFHKFKADTEQKDDISFIILQVEEDDFNKLVYPSTFNSIARSVAEITELLPYNYRSFNFLTGVKELIINAIEHGNKFDPDKKVKINYLFNETQWIVTIIDEGEGFNWEKAIENEFDLSFDNERGRGIALARMFSDNLIYNDKGNRVSLIMNNGKNKTKDLA